MGQTIRPLSQQSTVPRNIDKHDISSLCGRNPYRVNYNTLYPVSKRLRDCFAYDVVGSVDISIDEPLPDSPDILARPRSLSGFN